MANKKFSEFTLKTDPANVDFVVGYDGTDNVRIAPTNLAPVTSVNSLTGAVSLGLTELDDVGTDGTNGQVLTTNGSGSFTFQDAGGGGASDLNGLSDVEINTTDNSSYFINIPSGISGQNAQNNLVIGISAGNAMTTGDSNTAIGYEALNDLTTGFGNTAIGKQALGNEDTSSRNTAVGVQALYYANSSAGNGNNTGLGFRAGQMISTGEKNTCIGANAGWFSYPSTMSNNTLLGYNALPSTNNASNEITLGDSNIAALRCAVTSITSLSDERDKSEIKDLEYGLAFIDALQPREFVWDNRPEKTIETDEDGNETEVEFYSANKGKKDFGFIAQEVRELDNDTLRLVYTENEDKLEMSYGKLVPILVKAVQELKAEIELLKG